MKRLLVPLLVAAGIFVPAAAFAKAEPPTVGVRLLEAPVDRRDDPRARTYIVDHVRPGTTIVRKIGVVNRSRSTMRIALYAGAATISGGVFTPHEGSGGNDVSSWTKVVPPSIAAPPFDEASATVTITVPRDAPAGERYAVVWAQLPAVRAESGGPSEVNRVGLRIYLSVGSGGEPASDFRIESLQAARVEDGTPIVYARVRNTGGRALDMKGELRLSSGPNQMSAGPFPAKLGTTLGIGQIEPVTVPLSKDIPSGPWRAEMTLRSGRIEHTASARIAFPALPGKGPAVDANEEISTAPWWLVVIAGSAVLTVLLILILIKRRRDRQSREPRSLERERIHVGA